MSTFAESVAAALGPRTSELAVRWRERAHAATPRPARPDADASDEGEPIARAIVACLEKDARWQGEVMRLAWTSGAAAHAAGLSMHHVLKDADLLAAILLTAVEEAVRAGEIPGDAGSAADALAVARRLQRAVGLHQQAAVSSYVHALVGALRARWRLLRHDLRDPLGTIRSALSLMEDESVPTEMRTGPRIRAMVSRNAGSLESLIASGLDDGIAAALVAAPQELSLRDVALAVRRTLRDATRLAECEIVVDEALPSARLDEAAVELTLSTLLLAVVARARPGDAIRLYLPADVPPRRRSLVVRVACEPARESAPDAWTLDELALPIALAGEYGGRVTVSGTSSLDLELPLLPVAAARASSERRPPSSGRHARDDVARAD